MLSRLKNGWRAGWAKKFGSHLIIAVLVLIALELAIRTYFAITVGPHILWFGFTTPDYLSHHPEPSANWGSYIKYSPHDTRFDYDPETGERFEAAINTHGFRGKDYTLEKPADVIRIATLGASSTFGYNNRDNETYPFYMETLLNGRAANSHRFEVINFGIPHERSDQIVALFFTEVLPLHPDVVTFYEGVNDSKYGTYVRTTSSPQSENAELKAPPEKGLRVKLRRMGFVKQAYWAVRDRLLVVNLVDYLVIPKGRYTQDDIRRHMAGKAEAFLSNLSRIAEECHKRSIIFIVGNQQAKSLSITRHDIKGVSYADELQSVEKRLARSGSLGSDEVNFLTHSKLMKGLELWAPAHNVPLVNVIGALDRDRDVLVSWVHLSPKGNRMIAEAFATEIMRQPLAAFRQNTEGGLVPSH